MVSEATTPIERLLAHLELDSGQAMVITHLPDIRWATGFTGSNGCFIVASNRQLLITDGRYKEQVVRECPDTEIHIASGSAVSNVGFLLQEWSLSHLLLQKSRITWEDVENLREAIPEGVDISGMDPLPALRAVKSGGEKKAIQKALDVTEQVFEEILGVIEEGMSEQDLAAEIDHRHRRLGASGPAFETIVAFSDHAALPHARPGTRTLRRGDIILMDFGGVLDGYHSDMTRTVTFGRSDKLFLESYAAVQAALQASQHAARSGMTGEKLDGVARQVLTNHGLGSAFAHSLGHGVGLEIHELPSVSSRNQHSLPAGSIITLEPGVYMPGEFGIRIENMVRLSPDGCEVLNRLDTKLIRL